MFKWYFGIPTIEIVKSFEILNPRKDGVHLGNISVFSDITDKRKSTDDWMWSNWLCVSYLDSKSIDTQVQVIKLKVVDNEILICNGLSFWQKLEDCTWAKDSKYFPVNKEGLPLDYNEKLI